MAHITLPRHPSKVAYPTLYPSTDLGVLDMTPVQVECPFLSNFFDMVFGRRIPSFAAEWISDPSSVQDLWAEALAVSIASVIEERYLVDNTVSFDLLYATLTDIKEGQRVLGVQHPWSVLMSLATTIIESSNEDIDPTFSAFTAWTKRRVVARSILIVTVLEKILAMSSRFTVSGNTKKIAKTVTDLHKLCVKVQKDLV